MDQEKITEAPVETPEAALLDEIADDEVDEMLSACDDAFYEYEEDLEALNAAYIRAHWEHFSLW